jgi:hypothetical protein
MAYSSLTFMAVFEIMIPLPRSGSGVGFENS